MRRHLTALLGVATAGSILLGTSVTHAAVGSGSTEMRQAYAGEAAMRVARASRDTREVAGRRLGSGDTRVPKGTLRPGGPTKSPLPSTSDARAGFVTRNGSQLMLDGKPYRFAGINAYQLATRWDTNIGCGTQVEDFGAVFNRLRPNSMVRFWAFQAQGFNKNTRTIDFRAIDRVVWEAEQRGYKLILTLGEQAGVCDDGKWHDQAWYSGGYRQVYNDDGRGQNAVSYLEWVRLVVARYKHSPAVGMWELVNEPEASNCHDGFRGRDCYSQNWCPAYAAETLRDFFTTVGAEIKRIDPHHLVSSGTHGRGQCGTWGPLFELVHSSPGIDVASMHDYNPAPMDDGIADVIARTARLNKPLIFGEVGTDASASTPCHLNTAARRDAFRLKMTTLFRNPGVAGFLPWQWVERGNGGCNLEIVPGDPLLRMLFQRSASL